MRDELRALVAVGDPTDEAQLCRWLEAAPGWSVAGWCRTARSVLRCLPETRPDAVLVDTRLRGGDGFEVLRAVWRVLGRRGVAVAHEGRDAVRAFEVGAVDCLLRPLQRDDLRRALGRVEAARGLPAAPALERLLAAETRPPTARPPAPPQRIAVPHEGRYVVVSLDEVGWVEAAGNYVLLHVDDVAYRLRASLTAVARRLAPAGFVRIHRSWLVNLRCIRAVRPLRSGDWEVTLQTGHRLAASRSYASVLRGLVRL